MTDEANPLMPLCVVCNMVTASVREHEELHEASADQRAMVKLIRSTKAEFEKRIADISCMKLEEIEQFLNCIDKLIELHVDALTMDEYVESTREYLQRTSWTK